jgi:hypothetical protein
MWLRDCLPYDLEHTRVLLYGYDTGLVDSKSFQNIDDIAAAFTESITSIRKSYMVREKEISIFWLSMFEGSCSIGGSQD